MEDITRDFLNALSEDIAGRHDDRLEARLSELHPADIAEIFDRIEDEEVQYLWRLIEVEGRGDVLIELEEDVRESLLATLTTQEIAEEVLENIDSDVLPTSSENCRMKQTRKGHHALDTEDREDLLTLLRYPDGTAGCPHGHGAHPCRNGMDGHPGHSGKCASRRKRSKPSTASTSSTPPANCSASCPSAILDRHQRRHHRGRLFKEDVHASRWTTPTRRWCR